MTKLSLVIVKLSQDRLIPANLPEDYDFLNFSSLVDVDYIEIW